MLRFSVATIDALTIGTGSATSILDFFPFVPITLGAEWIDALPSVASARKAAMIRFVFSIA